MTNLLTVYLIGHLMTKHLSLVKNRNTYINPPFPSVNTKAGSIEHIHLDEMLLP